MGTSPPPYSAYSKLSLNRKMSAWTETQLKSHLKEKGADPIEGIYESSIGNSLMPKYKLGLIRNSTGYDLIYFSDATNHLDWTSGEIKATLTSTATPNLFLRLIGLWQIRP